MRSRLLVLITVVAVGAAACGASPGRSGSNTGRPETLLLDTAGGPLALRVPLGDVVFRREGGVPSPDGSLVVSTARHAGATELTEQDARTGEVVSRTTIPGDLQVRAVAEGGGTVALMAPLPPGWDPWTPRPRTTTTIVVADPTGTLDPRSFRLRGNYEPEAFSTGDGRLFLIQYLPPEAPSVYRVAVLDLGNGRVRPVVGPYKGPAERMPGTRLEQIHAPDGTQLYTLYTSERPGYAPHGAPIARNAVVSFVHVLNLADGWAHCVGLPKPFWHRPASAEALAASHDGSKLYVVDVGIGMVTVIDTGTLEILRTASIAATVTNAARTTATVSPDGSTLFVGVGRSVLEIDTSTFHVVRDVTVPDEISGLGLSADGTRLYAALGRGLEILDPTSGKQLSAVTAASPSSILEVSELGAA